MTRREERCTGRIVLKYALLQVPGLVLFVLALALVRRWIDFSDALLWGLAALWAAKDIALFPFVWRSYAPGRGGAGASLVGAEGVARERLDPKGYVRVRGELWQARLEEGEGPVEEGAAVRVRAVEGLTLIVEPGGAGR